MSEQGTRRRPVADFGDGTGILDAPTADAIGALAFAVGAYGAQSDLGAVGDVKAAWGALNVHLPGWDPASRTMPWQDGDDVDYEQAWMPVWFDAGVEAPCCAWTLVHRHATEAAAVQPATSAPER